MIVQSQYFFTKSCISSLLFSTICLVISSDSHSSSIFLVNDLLKVSRHL
ncbi:MAG: hypothetical protein Q8S84_05385 [bacterium]|nr:hypothetical protein [bacterium]